MRTLRTGHLVSAISPYPAWSAHRRGQATPEAKESAAPRVGECPALTQPHAVALL
jgi:hypothetical protein